MNNTLKSVIVLILVILLFIPCIANAQEDTKEYKPALIIKGTLVDNKGKSLKNKAMTVYIATSKTTVDTYKDEPKKPGIGKQIVGTGTLATNIEGVAGGGAYKLIDNGIVNPQTKTDEYGDFQFNASAKFIEGESVLIIAVAWQDYSVSYTTKAYPIVDDEENPLFVKIDKDIKIINLGKVKTLIK